MSAEMLNNAEARTRSRASLREKGSARSGVDAIRYLRMRSIPAISHPNRTTKPATSIHKAIRSNVKATANDADCAPGNDGIKGRQGWISGSTRQTASTR
jgi:hypothetical protein